MKISIGQLLLYDRYNSLYYQLWPNLAVCFNRLRLIDDCNDLTNFTLYRWWILSDPYFHFQPIRFRRSPPFLRLLLYFSRWERIRGADNRVVNSSLPRWSVARRSWVDRCCYVISVQIQYNILGWQLSNCGFFLENQRQFFHGTK